MTSKSIPQPLGDESRESTFIVNPLLPTREIHLIAGGSGAGKSTLACQIASSLMDSSDFFGFPILNPQNVAYLAFDRSEEGMRRTFERTLGSKQIPFPFYSTITSSSFNDPKYTFSPSVSMNRILDLHPDTDVLFLDGIGMAFTGDTANLNQVAKFVHSLIKTLRMMPRDLTIMALHQMGKSKKGNEYANARQRIHGSVAWAATAETCILVEPQEESNPENPYRNITICPRNAAERVLLFSFDDQGRLIPADDSTQTIGNQDEFLKAIAVLPSGEYARKVFRELADHWKASDATLSRWLEDALEKGLIKRVRKGWFTKDENPIQ